MEDFNKTLKNYFAGQGLTQSDVADRRKVDEANKKVLALLFG